MKNISNVETKLTLDSADIISLLEYTQLCSSTRSKLHAALTRIQHKQKCIMALCTLDDLQKDALCLATDIMRREQLRYSHMARNAAWWWVNGGHAIILKLDNQDDIIPHADEVIYYALEIIPPSQNPNWKPEDAGFDSLNMGWFSSPEEAIAEAHRLGLKVVACE